MLPFQRSRLMSLNPGIGSRFLFERNVLIKRATETGSTCAKFIVMSRYYLFLNGLYAFISKIHSPSNRGKYMYDFSEQ